MFDKIKTLNNLRKVQGEVNKEKESIYYSVEKDGYKILVRGDNRIEKLEKDGQEQKDLRNLLNDALKEVEKKLEKRMRGKLTDLGIDL